MSLLSYSISTGMDQAQKKHSSCFFQVGLRRVQGTDTHCKAHDDTPWEPQAGGGLRDTHIINAVQEAAGHIHLEHEDEAEQEDDDSVQVGCSEGGLQASDGSIHHHSDGDEEAHRCTLQGARSVKTFLIPTQNTGLCRHLGAGAGADRHERAHDSLWCYTS